MNGSNQNIKNFIFITNTVWSGESPRCRHQLATECSKLGHVFFIQKNGSEPVQAENKNITVLSPHKSKIPRKVSLLLPMLKKYETQSLFDFISDLIKKNNFIKSDTVIYNFNYDYYLHNSHSLDSYYLCNDDFTDRFPWPFSSLLGRYEQRTAKEAKACFAISCVLVDKLKESNSKTFLFRPGISLIGQKKRVTAIKNLTTESRIKVGYGGYINSRLNLDIIEKLLENRKFHVELFGPIHGKQVIKRLRLLKDKGLVVSKAKNNEDYINYLDTFDVLIAPYVISKATRAISLPNKILQYLQVGKPIVITNLPFLDEMLKPYLKVNGTDSWEQDILAVFQENTVADSNNRIKFAELHTWENTNKEILSTITSLG